ncbi:MULTISPECIES: phage tail protein [unclassified Streptomyces]|uniref:Phage tail protein n=1 Tax=Streptomyces sp. NBC_00180 TaxID=2903632 RepID=A0AAU1I8M9_9ACTN|nr:phage tail protein [Streptomyces sp. NBC_01017]WSV34854.1 phage tail protein [Streptomyces sp. NBC_01017]
MAQPHDAITASRFAVVIDGYEIASFSELSGIVTEVEPVDYLSSSDKEIIFKKLPGKAKPPTVVLKRGKTSGLELWSWHQTVLLGDLTAARKSASLVMYSSDGTPVARYYLQNAWPSKLEVGALRAGSSEVLMETVTLVCEHLQRVAP